MNRGKINSKIIIHVVLIIGSFIMVLPFLWMFLTSVKTLSESMQMPPIIIPKSFRWQNYVDVWNLLPFAKFYINTFAMVFFRIVFAIVFSSMAAYAFARIKFPGRDMLFMIVLIQMMIPSQLFVIPQYLLVSKLGWLNTIKALVVPGFVSAFGTFLLRQFFLTLPSELEEAAILDGCNRWQIYWKIAMPLAKSGMAALGIFTALFAWKDLMWPMVVNMSIEKMPLSAGLASLQGQYSTNYPQLMAGSLYAIIPMIILFIIFQKQFIQGIATTGSKS
ncbi:MAG: carbohydrate ABC transporter permease [Clostridiales bacterium]|nr:carbohydrate ABC transporter permease [Clostridiales bacterium]